MFQLNRAEGAERLRVASRHCLPKYKTTGRRFTNGYGRWHPKVAGANRALDELEGNPGSGQVFQSQTGPKGDPANTANVPVNCHAAKAADTNPSNLPRPETQSAYEWLRPASTAMTGDGCGAAGGAF